MVNSFYNILVFTKLVEITSVLVYNNIEDIHESGGLFIMLNWYLNLDLWKKIVYPIFGVVAIGIIACIIIFIPKYNGPEKNCTFVNERINLHDEYYITVKDIDDYNTISIKKNKDDIELSDIIGTDKHYIGVKVLIEHQALTSPKENHVFDGDDFKLKDHTGVQAKNFNFFSKENGLALETKDFITAKPIVDYSWYGCFVESGTSMEITLYYEFSKQYSIYDTLMVLEADFFAGRSGSKDGSDIVLAYRVEQE